MNILKSKIIYFALILVVSIYIIANYCNSVDARATKQYYDNLVREELKVGDSKDKIEEFFKKNNFEYSFEKGFNREVGEPLYDAYISLVYNGKSERFLASKKIFLEVVVDDNMRFKLCRVQEYYRSM